MMRFAGVVLDGEDVLAGEGDVMSRLAPEALCEATQAGVVIWQGRIIKNRFVGLSSDTAEQNDPIHRAREENSSEAKPDPASASCAMDCSATAPVIVAVSVTATDEGREQLAPELAALLTRAKELGLNYVYTRHASSIAAVAKAFSEPSAVSSTV